jgi:hypothetical protein
MPLASAQAISAALQRISVKLTKHEYPALNPLSISCVNVSTAYCSSLPRAVINFTHCQGPALTPSQSTLHQPFALVQFFSLIRSVNF